MKWVSCTAEYTIHYCNNSLAGVGGVIQLIMEREKYKKKNIFWIFLLWISMLACWEFQKWFRRTLPHIKKCPDVDLYFMWVYFLTAWRGGQYLLKIIKQTRWKKIGYDTDLLHFANFSMQSMTKNSLQSFKLMRFILDEMTWRHSIFRFLNKNRTSSKFPKKWPLVNQLG